MNIKEAIEERTFNASVVPMGKVIFIDDALYIMEKALNEIELQLNYSCYDEEVLKKTQNVWAILEKLKEDV